MMDIDLAAEALDKLLGLAEAGLLDRGMAGGIEDALAQGNPALLQSYINDLAAYEANAYFYGADADIRSLRESPAGSIGQDLPPIVGVSHAVPGTPPPGWELGGYVRHAQIDAFDPRITDLLSIENEYLDPNLLMGAEEALLYDRFGNPLSAELIVGHSSMYSGNVGADPTRLISVLNQLGVEVRPSIPAFRNEENVLVFADGRPVEGTDEEDFVFGEWNADWLPTTHGVTMGELAPTTIVYAHGMDRPGEGNPYGPGDREVVILHEAGHAIYRLLPPESRNRLAAREDLEPLSDEINDVGPPADGDEIDEYLADAFRAYLVNPAWFKTYFPDLADAIAREVNAAPALQGLIQFN